MFIKKTYKKFNVAKFATVPLCKPSKSSDQLSHTFRHQKFVYNWLTKQKYVLHILNWVSYLELKKKYNELAPYTYIECRVVKFPTIHDDGNGLVSRFYEILPYSATSRPTKTGDSRSPGDGRNLGYLLCTVYALYILIWAPLLAVLRQTLFNTDESRHFSFSKNILTT